MSFGAAAFAALACEGWWAVTDSNRRHSACKADALPTELTAPTKLARDVSPRRSGVQEHIKAQRRLLPQRHSAVPTVPSISQQRFKLWLRPLRDGTNCAPRICSSAPFSGDSPVKCGIKPSGAGRMPGGRTMSRKSVLIVASSLAALLAAATIVYAQIAAAAASGAAAWAKATNRNAPPAIRT